MVGLITISLSRKRVDKLSLRSVTNVVRTSLDGKCESGREGANQWAPNVRKQNRAPSKQASMGKSSYGHTWEVWIAREQFYLSRLLSKLPNCILNLIYAQLTAWINSFLTWWQPSGARKQVLLVVAMQLFTTWLNYQLDDKHIACMCCTYIRTVVCLTTDLTMHW